MGMMENETSNLSRLPRIKALIHVLMLVPNPWWGCYWDSSSVAKWLTEVTPAQGLTGIGCPLAQPGCALLPVHKGRRG